MSHRQATANSTGFGVAYTLDLTKAFQDGDLSADDYTHLRAERVGRPNLIHGIFVPVYEIVRDSLQWAGKKRPD